MTRRNARAAAAVLCGVLAAGVPSCASRRDAAKPVNYERAGIEQNEWIKAVETLAAKVEPETLAFIRKKCKSPEDPWFGEQHLELGIGVRNLLRENGFQWRASALDGYWKYLLFEASRK